MQALVSLIVDMIRGLMTPQVKVALGGLFSALIAAKFPGLDANTANAMGGIVLAITAGILIPGPGQSWRSVIQHPEVQDAIKTAIKQALAEHQQSSPSAPPKAPVS